MAYGPTEPPAGAKIARLPRGTFAPEATQVLDLMQVDLALKGLTTGFQGGQFGYFAARSAPKVVRLKLATERTYLPFGPRN